MLIVSHEMAFVREVSTKVVFMADGIIAKSGTPHEIFGPAAGAADTGVRQQDPAPLTLRWWHVALPFYPDPVAPVCLSILTPRPMQAARRHSCICVQQSLLDSQKVNNSERIADFSQAARRPTVAQRVRIGTRLTRTGVGVGRWRGGVWLGPFDRGVASGTWLLSAHGGRSANCPCSSKADGEFAGFPARHWRKTATRSAAQSQDLGPPVLQLRRPGVPERAHRYRLKSMTQMPYAA